MAPQGELWVPGFPQSIFVVLRKDGFAVTCCAKRGATILSLCKMEPNCVFPVAQLEISVSPAHLECEVVRLVCDRYSGKFSQSKFIRNGFVYITQDEALP